MRFSYHPLTSIFIALAVWCSLLPLRPMMVDHSFLVDTGLVAGAAGVVGAALAILRTPRAVTFLAQAIAVGAMVAWRGLSLTAAGDSPMAALRELTGLGVEAIRVGAPPLEPHPGLVWLLLLLTGLLVIVVELLVNVLEQPAWAIAPLALAFGISALVIQQDLPWTYVIPVLGGFLAVLTSVSGAPGVAVGQASNAPAHLASRVTAATAIGVVGIIIALVVSPLFPMGEKQPWNQAGPDGPIQLSDPTVRLEEDLRRPGDRRILTYTTDTGDPGYLRTVALPELPTRRAPGCCRCGCPASAWKAPTTTPATASRWRSRWPGCRPSTSRRPSLRSPSTPRASGPTTPTPWRWWPLAPTGSSRRSTSTTASSRTCPTPRRNRSSRPRPVLGWIRQ